MFTQNLNATICNGFLIIAKKQRKSKKHVMRVGVLKGINKGILLINNKIKIGDTHDYMNETQVPNIK